MKLKLCSLFSLAIAFAATPLRATTYYWKPGSTVGDYGTLSNWSTEGLTGADAAVLPGSGDALYYKGDYAFDLGQEQEFIECISDLTDIPLTSEIEADAQKGNFDKILALVDDWNKWGNIKDEDDEDDEINIDEPCHVYIYKEA